MKFSVIIPTKDRNDILRKSLKSLSKAKNVEDLQVIIINDSDNPVGVDTDAFPANLETYKNPGKGVASARNFGVSKAVHDWLIFMDDDMIVLPDTFLKLKYLDPAADQCYNINWVYPDFIIEQKAQKPFVRYLIYYKFDSMEGWSNDRNWNNKEAFDVRGVNSAFLVMQKRIFQKIGGYNTNFPFAGFEDHDLSQRLRQMGVRLFVDPTNIIYHNEEDRVDLENWLERKRRGAITRKVAVALGYTNLTLNYTWLKKTAYEIIFFFRKPLLLLLNHWPNTKKGDRLFFLLVNMLLGAYSCIGYTRKNQKRS